MREAWTRGSLVLRLERGPRVAWRQTCCVQTRCPFRCAVACGQGLQTGLGCKPADLPQDLPRTATERAVGWAVACWRSQLAAWRFWESS